MNDLQAKRQSKEAIDSGYAAWLKDSVERHSFNLFKAGSTGEDLMEAKLVFELSAIVESIIITNSKS